MLNKLLKTPSSREEFDQIADHFRECLADVFDINISRKRQAKLNEFTARALGFKNGLQQAIPAINAHMTSDCPADLPETIMLFVDGDEIDQIVVGAAECFISRQSFWRFRDEDNRDIQPQQVVVSETDKNTVLTSLFGINYADFRLALARHYQVTGIVIEAPDIDKYGVPPMASVLFAEKLLRDDMGLASCLTCDDIEMTDTGEDGSGATLLILKKS